MKLLLNDTRVDQSAQNNYGNNFMNLITSFIAIEMASKEGHFEIVKLLLNDSKVDPSDDNNYGNNFIDLK